ncbi:SdiA-regulated domain-containing protein [Myxococcota bacterium]|nr:SdiA-regulated domain-containing protein [Myxococcota bacterium]
MALLVAIFAGGAEAGPAVDLHQLRWYVHVDLIRPATGRTLAFWQDAIDAATSSANRLLEGRNGPFDRACCTRLTRNATVTTFGSPGDGRDVLDSLAEQNFFNTAGANGSNAFLIDSMTYCGGTTPAAIGCAERPACDGNGGDNPNLWMVVTADAFDDGILAAVVAHERGHNACLSHVANDECQIMQATVIIPGLGSCLAASECTNYRAARTTTASGLECTCHSLGGAIEPDATLCARSPLGLCSGGVCDRTLQSSAVRLVAAAAPGTAAGGPPDDALVVSAQTGQWSTLGQLAPTADDVRALEYAHDSATLYGVVPTVGDDRLVTIDPSTGRITATVGTLANGTDEVTAMAYDPGATSAPGDDRLLVLVVGTDQIARLRAISPSTPSSSTPIGALSLSPGSLFTGLAYDSIHDLLYAATPFGPNGLYRIDLASCTPSPCDASQLPGSGYFRDDASLSFSPVTGMLYLAGTAYSGQRTFFDVIDPQTGASIETLSLDTFTPAGLAAIPEPFGRISLLPGVLGVIVAYRARHGRNLRQRG